jgi:hypothetical protein
MTTNDKTITVHLTENQALLIQEAIAGYTADHNISNINEFDDIYDLFDTIYDLFDIDGDNDYNLGLTREK